MINKSDFVFILISLLLIAVTYYYMILKKEKKEVIIEQINQELDGRQQAQMADDSEAEDDSKPKTKADLIKEARKKAKKEQKEVH